MRPWSYDLRHWVIRLSYFETKNVVANREGSFDKRNYQSPNEMHLKFSYFVNNEEILNILVNLFIEAETAVILLKTQHIFCKEYKQGEIIQAIADAFATSNLLSRRILHHHFQTELHSNQ